MVVEEVNPRLECFYDRDDGRCACLDIVHETLTKVAAWGGKKALWFCTVGHAGSMN